EAFQAGSLSHSTAHERLARRLARCVEPGDWGVLIASSVDGACLAVANLDRQCPIYFHRSQSIRLPSGAPLPDAFGAASMTADHRIREVGAIGGVDPGDARGISGRAMLVTIDNGSGSGVWFRSLVDSTPDSSGRTRVVYLPAAGWTAAEATRVSPPLPVVKSVLGRDAELVITPGDGAIGGPRCGLIIASQSLIEAISRSPVWPAVVADPATQAAMTLTLEAICSQRSEDVPVQAMLSTHEENLRSRAERLATRVSAEPTIRSCQITAEVATICSAGPWSLPSRQLALTHRDWAASDWAARLLAEVPAVLVGVKDNAIIVDLRWIQPSDDAALVATLVGQPTAESSASSEPAPQSPPPG
ncbi:MAG: hypothetical protein ACO1RT_13940, partial [Planctomycetaceae bacterium]